MGEHPFGGDIILIKNSNKNKEPVVVVIFVVDQRYHKIPFTSNV